MKRRFLQAGLAGLILGWSLQPCQGGKLRAEVGPGADFARYKTYEWLPTRVLKPSGVVEDDPVLTPLIKDAINRQLMARGMTEVAQGGDLQVSAGALTASIPWIGMVQESIDNKPGGGQKKIGPAAERLFKKYPVAKSK